MKLTLTVPDGDYADSLMEEAGERYRTAASLCLDYVRGALIKRGYKIPKLAPRASKGGKRRITQPKEPD